MKTLIVFLRITENKIKREYDRCYLKFGISHLINNLKAFSIANVRWTRKLAVRTISRSQVSNNEAYIYMVTMCTYGFFKFGTDVSHCNDTDKFKFKIQFIKYVNSKTNDLGTTEQVQKC